MFPVSLAQFGRRMPRGQAMVEFALVAPILLMLFVGIVDGGRLVFTYNELANRSREAARHTMVARWPDECVMPAVLSRSQCVTFVAGSASVDPNRYTVTWQCTPAPCRINARYDVVVTVQFQALTPIIGNLIGPVTLSSTTSIPIESVCVAEPGRVCPAEV